MTTLRVILGDQCSEALSALDGLDPSRRTAVICQSSQRSGIGASILATRGFTDVHPVIGGGMGSPQFAATV